MDLPSTFSRRKRQVAPSTDDPLVYDNIPRKVRVQLIQIFEEAVKLLPGSDWETEEEYYVLLRDFMRKELGVQRLARGQYAQEEFSEWFLSHNVLDEIVDAIELIFRVQKSISRTSSSQKISERIANLQAEANARILEASIGYQFVDHNIIQIDSEFTHSQVVVPALRLLRGGGYEGAEQEFLNAFDAFRHGDFETSIVESCKALESTLKTIFKSRKWIFDEGATLKRLVSVAFENELIPGYLENEMSGLRQILQNGVGTLRNKSAGHGAGEKKRIVSKEIAAFQINQTAAAIRLFVESA